MQRTIAGHGANRYFSVFNFYDHSHIIFEEASAHFVPNTCPAIPVESIYCLWALVWTAYIKLSKTVDPLHTQCNSGPFHIYSRVL